MMPCDYQAIRKENKKRYGTDIGRIGQMLFTDLYDDRTHFIFELLQNAEDALGRRGRWDGSRAVKFYLAKQELRVTHFGQQFDEPDVRSICGIADSTKGQQAIGRFGIGFKSVYAFTDRPEIHSGTESFAIEKFVQPVGVRKIDCDRNQTVIKMPLKPADVSGRSEIAQGLGRLESSALLFLRQIREIEWHVEGGESRHYLRSSTEVAPHIRRVTVSRKGDGRQSIDEEWLVVSEPVLTEDAEPAGHAELAFSLSADRDSGRKYIRRIDSSPLVVFFPTVVETHLGFLVQGPFRTTPGRDNVSRSDEWNQKLIEKTARLLKHSLLWLRDNDLLDTGALRCLPLDATKFREASMFAPIYDATKQALASRRLLPRFDSGHVAASRARLGRSSELRGLFPPKQLAALFSVDRPLVWLSGDVTQDRTPELRRYLMNELQVPELTPESVVPRLNKEFLEAQDPDWIARLYHFLNGQPRLRRHFKDLPLVRLSDGTQVSPQSNGQPQAFLPDGTQSDFPIVHGKVCTSETSREFLISLGLTKPDPVDDVIRNILPRYRSGEAGEGEPGYESDIRRILTAFQTDSKNQRDRLVNELRRSAFVLATDAGNGTACMATPGSVYLATDRIKTLFAGVDGVLVVNDSYKCLRGEAVRELLEACGAARSLQTIPAPCEMSRRELEEIRRGEGLEPYGWEGEIADKGIRGLDRLLTMLQKMSPLERQLRAKLLWEALAELESRSGRGMFEVEYRWSYSHRSARATLDAAFVRQLQESSWIPGPEDSLQVPFAITFETLGWKPNPFLLSKIRFKPPIVEQLATEVGIEPAVLNLLTRLGLTSEAQLREHLRLPKESTSTTAVDLESDEASFGGVPGGTAGSTPLGPDLPEAPLPPSGNRTLSGSDRDHHATASTEEGTSAIHSGPNGIRTTDADRTRAASSGTAGGKFISYVGTHPDVFGADSDGLAHAERMELESKAIEFIRSIESSWLRTATHNPGFDLYQRDAYGNVTRWCEVKAMAGCLNDHPVGLSRTQFDVARERGEAYWIYIVEKVGTSDARIVRIQDPVGKARTYTFDEGWVKIGDVYPKTEC